MNADTGGAAIVIIFSLAGTDGLGLDDAAGAARQGIGINIRRHGCRIIGCPDKSGGGVVHPRKTDRASHLQSAAVCIRIIAPGQTVRHIAQGRVERILQNVADGLAANHRVHAGGGVDAVGKGVFGVFGRCVIGRARCSQILQHIIGTDGHVAAGDISSGTALKFDRAAGVNQGYGEPQRPG